MKERIRHILKEEASIPLVIRRRASFEQIEEAFDDALERMGGSMNNPDSIIYKEKGTTLKEFAKFVIDEMVTYLEQDYFNDDSRIYFDDDEYYYNEIRKPLIQYYEKRIKEKFDEVKSGGINETFLKEETSISPALHTLLNMVFEGFDDIYYDWANYNCGMGECCDPYAIGFTLPNSHYDDYLFKLVDEKNWEPNGDNYPDEIRSELPEVCYEQPDIKDPNFDVIIFYQDFADEIEKYLGSEKNWAFDLIDIINEKFGCKANTITFI